MIKRFLWATLIVSMAACQDTGNTSHALSAATLREVDSAPRLSYPELLEDIRQQKVDPATNKKLFFRFIADQVPDYWAGTEWDFNGTTRTPREGSIACGYFITNVLADFGISLRRVYLAQQVSSTMIRELCQNSSIKRYSQAEAVADYVLSRDTQEVYIVGLDFHTGFVVRDGDEVYFIHSNYIDRQGPVKEKLLESPAFLSSQSYMLGSLSASDRLFE